MFRALSMVKHLPIPYPRIERSEIRIVEFLAVTLITHTVRKHAQGAEFLSQRIMSRQCHTIPCVVSSPPASRCQPSCLAAYHCSHKTWDGASTRCQATFGSRVWAFNRLRSHPMRC